MEAWGEWPSGLYGFHQLTAVKAGIARSNSEWGTSWGPDQTTHLTVRQRGSNLGGGGGVPGYGMHNGLELTLSC